MLRLNNLITKYILPLIAVSFFIPFYTGINIVPISLTILVFLILFFFCSSKTSIIIISNVIIITIFSTLLANFFDLDSKLYYRPHERLQQFSPEFGYRLYKPNSSIEMDVFYGDLDIISSNPIKEKRKIIFNTDNLGYRNDYNYNNEKTVLVGDSFIVGIGNTQKHILSSILKNKFNTNTYNLSATSNPVGYVGYIYDFKKIHGDKFKAILFFYEGNDFDSIKNLSKNTLNSIIKSREDNLKNLIIRKLKFLKATIFNFYSESVIYRLCFSYFHIIKNNFLNKDDFNKKKVVTKVISDNIKMKFAVSNIEVTKTKIFKASDNFRNLLETIKDNVAHIYFIPTKYRVYYDFFDNNDYTSLSNPFWEYTRELSNSLNIKSTNLTKPLKSKSYELIKSSKLTYLKNDTHWNKNAMELVAKIVKKDLDEANLNN